MNRNERYNRILIAGQELNKVFIDPKKVNKTFIARLLAENEFEEKVFETLNIDGLRDKYIEKFDKFWREN